jgi:peptide deformylase
MNKLLDRDNPILRKKAAPVTMAEYGTNALRDLVNEMFEIMKEKAAVGVAAPQIGCSKQVIVFSSAYTKTRNIEALIPDTVLINPSFRILSEELQTGYEGCLNCGDLRGPVPRAMEIEYTGFDLEGNAITKRAKDLEARIVQHEVDHLNGILFLDHVANPHDLITIAELQQRSLSQ